MALSSFVNKSYGCLPIAELYERSKPEHNGISGCTNLAVLVVLRAVARAHELVSGLVPGHNAAQMGAHRIHAWIEAGRGGGTGGGLLSAPVHNSSFTIHKSNL